MAPTATTTAWSTSTSEPGSASVQLGWADWKAIGTVIRLVVMDATKLGPAREMLADDLAALDAACSRFRDDSELMGLEAAAGRPTKASPLLIGALRAALRGARLTDGDVDPTVGHAMEALGYDRDFGSVPADGQAVTMVISRIASWRQIEVDDQAGLVSVPAGVRLDLGATAKAWAADRSARRVARELGCGVLVSLGGDIAVAGDPPPGGWSIRLQDITGDPAAAPEGPTSIITIRAGGVATSSTRARRWRRGGDVMHHILDPRTGRSAESVWRTVSVAAASALDANIASTASVIRGQGATGWLAAHRLPARLVALDGSVTTVAGWPKGTSS
jgi:thiamine biosynthesis lipoprotein ApbE